MERPKNSPTIIAHQGYGRQHSENMLLALRTATAERVEMIEIDVHETRDGRFIVHHDDAIHRNSPEWRHLTYSEIERFNNHHERAPLLSECLKTIGSTPVDIEIKSYVNVDHIARELRTSSLAPRSVISSGDCHLLRQLHTRGVKVPLVLILAISNRRSVRQNVMNVLLCLAPHRMPQFLGGIAIYHYLACKRLIYNLQQKGISVFVWTVDEKKKMRKFIDWGVDGIITNYPHRLYELLTTNERLR